MKTEREITYGTLIWNISWQQSVYNGSYQCPVVSATGTIEFSPEMQRLDILQATIEIFVLYVGQSYT